jgi:hypothetical protein
MGCRLSNFPVLYFGISLSDKRLAKVNYLPLIHKIANKLPGSSVIPLSMDEKIIIVNIVLFALPIYFMSDFILPKWVIHEINII